MWSLLSNESMKSYLIVKIRSNSEKFLFIYCQGILNLLVLLVLTTKFFHQTWYWVLFNVSIHFEDTFNLKS